MTLQNFIYLLFSLVWLSGLIWSGVIAFRSRKTKRKEVDHSEPLNLDSEPMNARNLRS